MASPLRLVLSAAGMLLFQPHLIAQDTERDFDLSWKLPHDRLLTYDFYEVPSGVRKNEILALACELTSKGPCSTDSSDIPARFALRSPNRRFKIGALIELKEPVFEGGLMGAGMTPLEATGATRLVTVREQRVEEILKVAGRKKSDKSPLQSIALLETHVEFFRRNIDTGKPLEKKASAQLDVLQCVRISDGALLGGRYTWTGRSQRYARMGSEPSTSSHSETREFLLSDTATLISLDLLTPRINKAVELGVRWLKLNQGRDGSFHDTAGYEGKSRDHIGSTALCILALTHSGISLEDPAIRSGLHFLSLKKPEDSYDAALYLQAIEAQYLNSTLLAKPDKDLRLALRDAVRKEDKSKAQLLSDTLIAHQGPHGGFSYKDGKLGDLSNSLYAALGLKSASRMGVKIEPRVWVNLFRFVTGMAQLDNRASGVSITLDDGQALGNASQQFSWGYRAATVSGQRWETASTGTMTAAALSILAIAHSELTSELDKGAQDKVSEQCLGGFDWIGENYSLRATPPMGCWYSASHLYNYLYSLERAAILNRVETIDGHNWFLEGAALLTKWQHPEGQWESQQSTAVIDTAFALLFLRRAILPIQTPPTVASIDSTKRAKNQEDK